MQKKLLLSVRDSDIIIAGLSFSFTSQVAEAREHRLLIINSYNEAAPWSQELITPIALLTARTDGVRADIIHMNGTFIRNESMYRQVDKGIFKPFEDRKPD